MENRSTFASLRFPRAARAVTLVAALAALSGCVELPEEPVVRVRHTGDAITDANLDRAAAPTKDKVLWDYRIATLALRTAHYEEARNKLDDAIGLMGGIIANSEQAERAYKLFAPESDKPFIGEPYERAMAYYYRGILYWHDGQPDNARACFRAGQFIDSAADEDRHKGDYVLLDYLDGLVTAKLGGDGTDSFARAKKNFAGRELPAYDPAANVLFFVEFGQGPRKYAGGEYGEQLRFATTDSKAFSAAILIDDETKLMPAYDDLNFQATTRGGRVMDYVLGRKAVFKSASSAVGDLALAGAVLSNDRANEIERESRRKDRTDDKRTDEDRKRDEDKADDARTNALIFGLAGVIAKGFSAATTPQADTRQWDTLPQRLSFAAYKLAPGLHSATIQFYDRQGQPLPTLTQHIVIPVSAPTADGAPVRDTVLFLSEHKS